MKDINHGLPELKALEEVVGQYDFLIQEGVVYRKAEYDRAWVLVKSLMKLLHSFQVK